MVKAADMHPLDTESGKPFQLFTQIGKPHRCQIRREKFTRVRLECQHTGGQSSGTRRSSDALKHRTMAEMNTIEVAYGKGNRR